MITENKYQFQVCLQVQPSWFRTKFGDWYFGCKVLLIEQFLGLRLTHVSLNVGARQWVVVWRLCLQ
jgi:hypothetical protein